MTKKPTILRKNATMFLSFVIILVTAIASGLSLFTTVDGVALHNSVKQNGVVSEVHTGNDEEHGGTYLARPFAVNATSVKMMVKGTVIKITDWTSIPDAHDRSFDSYVVFLELAFNDSPVLESLTPSCVIPKGSPKTCIVTAADAGAIYNIYVATLKTLGGQTVISTAEPRRIMTQPLAMVSMEFQNITSSSLTIAFNWEPSAVAVQDAEFHCEVEHNNWFINDKRAMTPTKALKFENLAAGSIYYVTCRVVITDKETGDKQQSVHTPMRQQITKPKAPSWVGEPKSFSAGTLSLKWENTKPSGNWNCFVLFYKEQDEPNFNRKIYSKQRTAVTLDGLPAGRYFSLKMQSSVIWYITQFNKKVVNSDDSELRMMVPTKPMEPSSITVAEVTSQSFSLKWHQNPTPNIGMTWEVVCFDAIDHQIVEKLDIKFPEADILQIKPGADYECNLKTSFGGLKSNAVTIKQLTKPGIVANLRITNQTATSLVIEWDKPKDQDITSYVVFFSKSNSTNVSTFLTHGTRFNRELEYETNYTVFVKTRNSVGESTLMPKPLYVPFKPIELSAPSFGFPRSSFTYARNIIIIIMTIVLVVAIIIIVNIGIVFKVIMTVTEVTNNIGYMKL